MKLTLLPEPNISYLKATKLNLTYLNVSEFNLTELNNTLHYSTVQVSPYAKVLFNRYFLEIMSRRGFFKIVILGFGFLAESPTLQSFIQPGRWGRLNGGPIAPKFSWGDFK